MSNAYDSATLGPVSGVREFTDPATIYRGNLGATTRFGSPTITMKRDATGNILSSTDGLGHTVSATVTSTTNFVAPSTLTVNSDSNSQQTMTYTPWLAVNQVTAPNSASASTIYDAYGRPQSSTAVDGAQTGYSYSPAGSVMTVTATTNTHWVRTATDGFGRTIKVERGYGSTTISRQDTAYDSCACSPLGKVKQASQPYVPGAATIYWTVSNYDGLGRPTSAIAADGASTTTYAYAGNATTVTDPAGKWKQQVMDVFGDLNIVNEPNPAGGANLSTNYTYDALNHLTQVSMTRGSTTQIRTFVFDPATGRLQSETHPESGTKTYTYNTDGTVATKIDAKNQKVAYTYDTLQRVTQIKRYPVSTGTEDSCQRTTFTYDTNSTFTQNGWGRVVAADWGGTTCAITQNTAYAYAFSYTPSGLTTKKRVSSITTSTSTDKDVVYTYNNEGKQVSIAYPSGGLTYTYTFDSMGRPLTLKDSQATPVTWVYNAVHCCPARSRTESTGCRNRVNRIGSLVLGKPVKWALFQRVSG